MWSPGETPVVDGSSLPGGLPVFCAVLASSRVRFVRVDRDETAATALAMLADCFDMLGGCRAALEQARTRCANIVVALRPA